ncbi:MAG TPA: alpha/beta hydrolase [Pseudonocardiaceae bacterium]|nr:alpha/beta hydrolase [Pseudonocardiaceae bacterium]
MITETDIALADGRTLHVYDTGHARDTELTVYWHAGTPQIGQPPADALQRAGVRWIGHDRPSYGGSTALPGRTVASVADDVRQVVDALGVQRFALLGSSGGGPPALACAALLPERVLGVACLAGIAPADADGLDWFAGMAPSGVAELGAALRGADVLGAHLAATRDDAPDWLSPKDIEMFTGPFGPWLIHTSTQGMANGPDGFVGDDIATTRPWGFDPAQIEAPVLLCNGDEDRCVPLAHAEWLARRCPHSELRPCPGDSHISIFGHAGEAVDWLAKLG